MKKALSVAIIVLALTGMTFAATTGVVVPKTPTSGVVPVPPPPPPTK